MIEKTFNVSYNKDGVFIDFGEIQASSLVNAIEYVIQKDETRKTIEDLPLRYDGMSAVLVVVPTDRYGVTFTYFDGSTEFRDILQDTRDIKENPIKAEVNFDPEVLASWMTNCHILTTKEETIVQQNKITQEKHE